jgi:DNA-binding NarL/FixJ family response regulator/signal transduction histidine kinase
VLSQNPTIGAFLITLGLAALAAAWVTWMNVVHPTWARHRWLVVMYFVGLVVFAWLLTVRSPWFAFFTWIGFLYAFEYLPGVWRWIGCVPVAIPFAIAQTGGFHQPTAGLLALWAILTCVDMGLVGAFVLLGVRSEEQNQARKGMIAELAHANQRLEEMMAENTGLQAQLLIQAREAGAGDERQRMAREIHDTLAQGLTGIIAQLEAAQQTASDTERDRRIGNATRLARDSLAEARRSAQALRPKALEDSRLPDALAEEAARWSVTSGVAAEVKMTGDVRALHPEVEVTLLRVAQEALANVAKHAAGGHGSPAAAGGHGSPAAAGGHGSRVIVTGAIRLLIADDHPVVRDGLKGIFEASGEVEVVGEAANGREAVDRTAALRPDVVLMDLRMPVLDGVSAIKLLAERGVAARVLVLTTFDTDTDVVPAIEAGATGYLLKDSPPDELLRGVRAAARGEAVLSPSVATRLLGQVREPARDPLSQRELDILGLIARGYSNREAAVHLFISEATVKTHVLHIYAKLGVNDRAAAVAAGFERGLLPRPLPARRRNLLRLAIVSHPGQCPCL